MIISDKSNFQILRNLHKSIKNEVVGAQFGAQFINQCGPEQLGPFVNHRKTLKSLIISDKSNAKVLENFQNLKENEVVSAQFSE